ncbi:MAG: phosphotransferase [Planctomycetota bacterium]
MDPAELPDDVRGAAARFDLGGAAIASTPLVRGHIHRTHVVTVEGGARFLLQRMNERVFTDVPGLMHNIAEVTSFLARSPGELEALRLVPTVDGAAYHRGPEAPWRAYHFVEGTLSLDRPESPDMARDAAAAFADFQVRLTALDPDRLRVTIPGFFDSLKRLRDLRAVVRADRVDRAAGAAREIAFVEERADQMGVMERALEDGRMPARIVHGDTKLNNVLLDADTRRPRCIVDLDTCMPGYALFDLGDMVRFTASTAAEDERDLDRVSLDLDLYRAIEDGYLSVAGEALTPFEREHLGFSARLVTLTLATRFLADHIDDGGYFQEHRDGHNLDRARAQLRLVAEMERLV